MRKKIYHVLDSLGFARLFRWLHRRRVTVLMYHGVLPDDDPLGEESWLQVRESEFRWQMAYLKKHYEVVRLCDVLKSGAEWNGRPRAVVTFDDGYANNYHWALPILREFGITATLFVTTGHIDTHKLFWWDRLRITLAPVFPLPKAWIQKLKAMDPSKIDGEIDSTLEERGLKAIAQSPVSYRSLKSDELRALIDSGLVDIGSHTHGHEILEHLPEERVRATLRASVEALAGWGITTHLFAAPNGDYTQAQTALMNEQGFTACVATHQGVWDCPTKPHRIPRFGVGRGIRRHQFALMISGCLLWLNRLRGKRVDGRH